MKNNLSINYNNYTTRTYMKNLFRIIIAIILIAAISSCGDKNDLNSKKAALDALKTEQQNIAEKISALQKEIEALDTTKSATATRSKLVAIEEIKPSLFEHSIDVQGFVDGEENITYSAKVPAVVQKIHVTTGQQVRTGQVLIELDNKAVKAQLETLKANYELVKTLFEKQKALWEQQVGSEVQYLQAKTNKESLEKQIAALKENIDMYTIKSDFSGTIDLVTVKVGQNVAPGVPCVQVVNASNLKVKANISESYAASVKTGNKALLYFPDLAKSIETVVSHASKSINVMTRTFAVEVNLQSDNTLRPNMLTELKIIDYSKKDAIVVPINTIQKLENEDVVFVSENTNGKILAKKRLVKVGKIYNGKAEITAGLQAGDKLITVGFQDLVDNQAIQL